MSPDAKQFRTHPVFEWIRRRKGELGLIGKYLSQFLMALGGDMVLDISNALMGTAQSLPTYVARKHMRIARDGRHKWPRLGPLTRKRRSVFAHIHEFRPF